jgi:DNA-directed RNA polymerase II subunit RPB2
MDNSTIWKIIDKYFEDNPQCLVRHHVESYNDFFKNGIFQIFKEKNPIRISTRFDDNLNDYRSQCIMYFGGKEGNKIYFGKPVIYDDNDNSHYMCPNEARLRNMTYGMTIHYDVDIEFIDILDKNELPNIVGIENIGGNDENAHSEFVNFKTNPENEQGLDYSKMDITDKEMTGGAVKRKNKPKRRIDLELSPMEMGLLREATEKSMTNSNRQIRTLTLEKIFLGKFPIMVQSNYCILSGLPREVRHTMGECRNDVGGYFIIDGKEKTVVSQEKFGDNMLYIRKSNDDVSLYSAEIRSVSENVAKPIRTLSVKIMAPTASYSNKNFVVNIPNVRKPVPLFIVFRALGIISDKQIITMCLLDLDKYESMVDLFAPSVHDAGGIMTQRTALKYIATLTKRKTVPYALEILSDYFLPHVGETNYIQKAYYLGHIVFKLLSVYTGLEPPTDRDNFKFKRIELVGSLMYDLFREYYTIQQRQIHLAFESKITYNRNLYENNLYGLIQENYKAFFGERSLEAGFKKAFKGNWGAFTHTKRIGVVQDLNRLSHNSALSHLRKTNLPLDASVKLVGPRVLHNTQWGLFDPIDTPDGGNIGIHKHMSISAYVTQGVSREPMIKWLRENIDMKLVEDCTPKVLSTMTKVMINGLWAGSITTPLESVEKIRLFRRNALLPIYTSVTFDIKQNTVFIYTDAGRLCRPIFYRDTETGKMSFDNKFIKDRLEDNDFTWNDLISGFNEKKIENFNPNNYKMYQLSELYKNITEESNPAKLNKFLEGKAILDYLDTNESENALIAMNKEDLTKDSKRKHTHMEIHESLIFGMMCNIGIFPENNPATRNSFSCGQSKQACSMYHTNHQVRMDKTSVVLVNGQVPLVKSRYLEHINHEENTYGENAIVAIMCYTGYNVEDAILINEGALKRGLFRTTYYTTYETHEEKSKSGDGTTEKIFTNIDSESTVIGTKPGYDYSKLDKYGLIRENTPVDDKTVLIGLTVTNSNMKDTKMDMSKTPKKGQLGIVDKSFITDGEEGNRIAKIRIREERIPNIGDKMASRAGQKGTVGLVVPERDMPFTKDGIRPDIIINPHAIPTRMTIGQLVETIVGKASAMYGGYADCTAFNNRGSKIGVFGEMLTKAGYHSSGNELLYNGMTGEQLETEIFIGPNYYMRLKHMVKDKINYRALGPRSALTRQTVGGRANDGGLRIGEMERDSVISHGAAEFLRESLMERGDKYKLAICNTTGLVAIYNPSKNVFMSPMADGPIKFITSMDGNETHIENITKYGRSFSIINVPYSLKLLIQELQTINVQMRIITEDNIQQLENMSFSKNINLLTADEKIEPKDIINQIKQAISKSGSDALNTPESIIENIPTSPEFSPPYPETSPAYESPTTPNSPPYPETSPAYEGPESPPYEPTSPSSPPYNPFENENKMVGGFDNNINYNIGEPVYYRGDNSPKRLWKIIDIGNQFITIEANTNEYLGTNDTVQVVLPSDIYRPNEIIDTSVFNEPLQPTAGLYNSYDQTNYPTQPFMNQPVMPYPPINIKVVSGNDFSTNDNKNDMNMSTEPTNTISAPDSFGIKMNNDVPAAIKINPNLNNETIKEDTKPNNDIDFSKGGMVIVKKG